MTTETANGVELTLSELIMPSGQNRRVLQEENGYLVYRVYPGSQWAVNDIFAMHGRRGQGIGARLLRRVCALADGAQASIKLYVASGESPDSFDNVELAQWYARHGFVPDEWDDPAPFDNRILIRSPR